MMVFKTMVFKTITICRRGWLLTRSKIWFTLTSLSLSEPISSSPVQYCHHCPGQSCHSWRWFPPDVWSDSAGDNHFDWSLQLCRSDPVNNPSIINSKNDVMEKYIRRPYLPVFACFHQYYLNIDFADFIFESIQSNSNVLWNKMSDKILKWHHLCLKSVLF